MRVARFWMALSALLWWALYLMDGGGWVRLVGALSFTLAWFALALAGANRRVDQMTENFIREQRGDDPR
jgi:hypothetical protein